MAKNTLTASRPFKLGMLFVLPLVTLILALTHHVWIKDALSCYDKDETCKAFAIPVTSTLHGVRSPRLPNMHINYTSFDGKETGDIYVLDILTDPIGTLREKVFGLFTKSIAGQPFVKSSDANMPHFNTRCSLAVANNGLGQGGECETSVRQHYAAYALNCYDKDTMVPNYKISSACQCLSMFQLHLYGADNAGQNMLTGQIDKATDLKHAVLYCAARNENSYTVDYSGVMNTYGLAINGMLFLAWGLFSIVTRMATDYKGQYNSVSKDYYLTTLWVFAGLAQLTMIVLVFVYTLSSKTYKEDERGHAIMHLREDKQMEIDYTISGEEYLEATGANEASAAHRSTQGLTRSVLFVGWSLQVVVLLLWSFCYWSGGKDDGKKWRTYTPVLARVGTDLPIIVGFTLLGVSVMLQNGNTNYSFLDYNLFVILVICLLQHVSNVTKLFYDAVCRQTKSQVFTGLTRKNRSLNSLNMNSNIPGITKENDDREEKLRKKIITVLQFFGWIRVWIFLLVTLFCFLLLTGTNELEKALPLGNFTQSQVFVFVIALFLTNVTYDIVRELLPVQFENHDTDSARLYIITIYILYYVVNQRLFIDKMNE